MSDHGERARALLARFDEPERHLDFESETVPFVDGTIGAAEKEIVESHLEDCRLCRDEVEVLQRDAAPRRRRRFLAQAAAVALLIASAALVVILSSRPRAGSPQPQPPRVQSQPTLPDEWRQLVDRTLAAGRLPESPHLAALQTGTTLLRGASPTRAVVEPDGKVVESAQPRFTWPEAPEASYRVFVYAGDREVAASAPLQRAEWTPPRPLERGHTYQWQVETTRGSHASVAPAPVAARFRVVSEAEHRELEAARAAGDPLPLAVLYARAGLVELAHAELQKLAASPDPRVQRLLRSYDASPNSTKPAQ